MQSSGEGFPAGTEGAIVIEPVLHENTSARDDVRSLVGADGTQPVVFGFGQLRGDPLPGREGGTSHYVFGSILSTARYGIPLPAVC